MPCSLPEPDNESPSPSSPPSSSSNPLPHDVTSHLFTVQVPHSEETITLIARNQILIALDPQHRRLVLTMRDDGTDEGTPSHPCVGILLGERATSQFILTCQQVLNEMRTLPL